MAKEKGSVKTNRKDKTMNWRQFTCSSILLLGLCGFIEAVETSGQASWYSKASCQKEGTSGVKTASGKVFDENADTCASWFYPFGTKLRVTYKNKSVIVVVTDRGPSKKLVAKGRIIDLSKGAFEKLAPLSKGVIQVTIEEEK